MNECTITEGKTLMFNQMAHTHIQRALFATALLLLLVLPSAAFADDIVIEDQASCEAVGGTFSALGICVVDSLTITAGDVLLVSDSAYLRVTGSLTVLGEFHNEGITDLLGDMLTRRGSRVNNLAIFTVRPSAVVDNRGHLENTGQISNGGIIDNSLGIIDNVCEGIIFGSGEYLGKEALNTPGTPACASGAVFLPHISS
ncbi:MAG: hypothetical protein ACK2UK_18295 [Candidatus Promineifilaceae bacterium]